MITDKIVSKYRSLPEWVKREGYFSCQTGWVYSGMKLIGWSWTCSTGIKDDFKEGVEGEIIPSEPEYYISYIKQLLCGDYNDLNFSAEERGGQLVINSKAIFENKNEDDGPLEFEGVGDNRIEALISLLSEVADFYYHSNCPSLNDINSDNLVNQWNKVVTIAGVSSNPEFEFDVFEDEGGDYAITFNDYNIAVNFIEKYHRFVIDNRVMTSSTMYTMNSEHFHGTVQMMEGAAKIYSNYGIELDQGSHVYSTINLTTGLGTGVVYGGTNNIISSGSMGIITNSGNNVIPMQVTNPKYCSISNSNNQLSLIDIFKTSSKVKFKNKKVKFKNKYIV